MRTVPRRILIVRPSAFGDVCRTVPLLWSLRKTFPKAVIDWVVEDRWSPAIQEHPAIDGVVKFPKREFRSCWRNPKTAIKTIQWFWRLRRGRYDLVIDAQGLARSGLMSLVTGAKVRVANRSGRAVEALQIPSLEDLSLTKALQRRPRSTQHLPP